MGNTENVKDFSWATSYLVEHGMGWLSTEDIAREVALIETIHYKKSELKRVHAELREALLIILTHQRPSVHE